MTFRGNLLLYSLWYELHPFENLRRKGHHCHGLTHLSWAERKIFYRFLGKKFCGLFIYPGQSVRQVVAVYAPGDSAKWHLNRSQFGIRIDHDLASISDHSLASQSITIWHASDH
ncbi:hypothetical protein [Escherichia coli]|uniref:hypothetical protein n=7 Tax=Enterobacterales TaxID=91347 RepID=UPI000AF56E0D|nr:hypothetical protein [Escherichia coli]